MNSIYKHYLYTALLFIIIQLNFASSLIAKPIQWNSLAADQKKELITKFPSLGTNSPTLEELDKALRSLMEKDIYSSLGFVNEEGFIKLEFQFLKTIQHINYTGLSSFDARDLNPILQLEVGQRFDARMLVEIREKIKSYYNEQGYLNTRVDVSVADYPDNLVDLNIQIQEETPLKVGTIFIAGDNNDLITRLNRLLKRHLDKIYNPQLVTQIPKDIQDYFRTNSYIRATVSGPEVHMNPNKSVVDLTYHIERTEQYSINFQGNYIIPSPRLLSAIDFNTLSSTSPNIVAELSTKLKEFYWKKGHARVDIKGEEKITQINAKSSLFFTINEGSPVKIESIDIQGSFSQPVKFYKSYLETHSGETVSSDLFHRNNFEDGIKNLIIELQNSGYLKAKLISTRYLYNKNKDRISISVNLDEGPLTRIRSMEFHGLKNLTVDELTKPLNLKTGEALKLTELEQGIMRIQSYAKDKGYLEFRILNEKENLVKYNEDNTFATLNFIVEEGPIIKVNNIIIDGNSLTKEYVFRKEIDFKEGEILTPYKIEESTRRLQKLGLFNSVEIKTLEQRTQVSERTVVIKVSERPPGLFNIGAGVTNERKLTVRGFAGVAYRNIEGTARGISTRAELNYNVAELKFPELKVTAGYLEPYIFDSRTKGRMNFTRAIQVENYEKRTASDTYQLDFLLENSLTSHILFTYDLWNISHVRDFEINSNNQILLINLASTGPALEIDYRDHPLNPTQGTLTRLQMEYSNPFLGNSRDFSFLKSTGSFTHYLPLSPPAPVVWANSLRVGDLQKLSGTEGIPYDKKGFFLGGLSTIRGYEGTKERFPNNTDLLISPDETYQLKDRNQFFLIKSEVRFPLWGSVGGAVFYDGGLITVDKIKFDDPYRDAAGIGIHYNTPVGPLKLDLAWKLDTNKKRDEEPWAFHISFGTF